VKLYKRLKRQWLFGVCQGLAEASGLSVWVLRAAVIVLLFGGKIGLTIAVALYLLLDMSLQVHPEDRRFLLRFRFKRWRENRVTQG
jgi:phage shock protein PspC (stress-responsive transcriptional regulator)